MKRAALLAIVLCWVVGARAEIQFKGLLVADGVAKFSLYSTEDLTSKWVSVGQSFANSEVVEFDHTSEVLTILQGTRRIELRIAASVIPVATPVSTEVRLTDAGVAIDGKVLSVDELKAHLSALDKNAGVIIKSESGVRFGTALLILDTVRAAGFTRVVIATGTPAGQQSL